MEIVESIVLVAAVAIGWYALRLLTALGAVVMAWGIGVATALWGPAYDPNLHPERPGFWVPWAASLLLACALACGAHALRSRLLLDGLACGLVFLPNGDDHERQKHGVDHAKGGVDETGNVVVPLARLGGHEPMHQLEAYEREEQTPPTTKTP